MTRDLGFGCNDYRRFLNTKRKEEEKKNASTNRDIPVIHIQQILMIFSFSVGLSNHEERPCKHGTFSKGSQAAFQGH